MKGEGNIDVTVFFSFFFKKVAENRVCFTCMVNKEIVTN